MKIDGSLYLVTDSTYHTEQTFLETIDEACKGGVTLVQLREKNRSKKEYFHLACQVKKITDAYHIPLIIDDQVDIAMAVDAAGVHVGAEDLPVSHVRTLLGEKKIVGATAKTVEQAKKAEDDGADYLGVGAIYETTTKVITKRTSVSTLNDICAAVSIPVIAIGGLNESNLGILSESKIHGIAVVSAIMKAKQPREMAARLKEQIINMKQHQMEGAR